MKSWVSRRARRRIGWIVAASLVSIAATTLAAERRATAAIRLVVQPAANTWEPGRPLGVNIRLRDVTGATVTAARNYDVQVSVQGGKGATASFVRGRSAVSVTVTPNTEGIVEIRATHAEMLPGSSFVRVARKRAQGDGWLGPLEDALRQRSALVPASMAAGAAHAALLGQHPPASLATKAAVTMRASPSGGVLATGSDAATIQIWIDPPPGRPVTLHFSFSAGHLSPSELTIPPGESYAEATLTSSVAKTVEVGYPGSHEITGDRVQVEFVPPVAALAVEFSPKTQLTLLDKGEIVVILQDATGSWIKTGQDRTVTLIVEEGKASLSESSVTIPKGQDHGTVPFSPTWHGSLKVKASTDQLVPATQGIDVSFPYVLFALCVGGGAIGGVLSTYGRHWRSKRILLRVLVGVATGTFIYFWAVVLGGSAFSSQQVLASPLSAFVVAGLGGWAGTKVFSWAARSLGPKAALEDAAAEGTTAAASEPQATGTQGPGPHHPGRAAAVPSKR
jgi:hypothetical protein